MKVIKSYDCFNQRRYSDPWVAKVKEDLSPDFSEKVGKYSAGYRTGDSGDLYISEPEDGAIYAYGQKDYRGGNTEVKYVQFLNNEFIEIERSNLYKYFN